MRSSPPSKVSGAPVTQSTAAREARERGMRGTSGRGARTRRRDWVDQWRLKQACGAQDKQSAHAQRESSEMGASCRDEATVRPQRFTQAMTAPVLQFKAGRAFRQGETNTVVAQPDRGCVSSCFPNLVVADPQLVILSLPSTLAPVPPAGHDHSLSITLATSQRRRLVLPSSHYRPSQPRLPPE